MHDTQPADTDNGHAHAWTATHRTRSTRADDRRVARRRSRRDAAIRDETRLTDRRSTVTVAIPAHNEERFIAATVRACQEQIYPPERIIVVADNCTDRTAEIAAAAGADVIVTSHSKKSKNLNAALADCASDVLVGIDADSEPAPDMLDLMLRDLDEGYDATSATVMPQQARGLFVRSRRFSYAVTCTWWRWLQSQVGRMHCMSGCGWAVRVDALRRAGGVPTDLVSEARDMTWTLYASGARITFSPQAVVYTHEPETAKVYVKQMRRWSASFFQVAQKHRRELRKPATFFITATATWDIVTVPVLYLIFLGWLAGSGRLPELTAWMVVQSAFSIAVAARTIGWLEALKCFPANKVVMVLDKAIYFATFVREWILGRHYASWTGRQGRKTEITPMSRRRKLTLGTTGLASFAGLAAACAPVTLPLS